MSLEIYNWNELPPATQEGVANLVAAYTQGNLDESPQMLPVTKEEVFAKFAGAVAYAGEAFGGYVAAAQPLSHAGSEMTEVGSLWVPFSQRGQGVAHRLVQYLSQHLYGQGKIPYAFCNPLSIGVFLNSGYTEAGVADIPALAFTLCAYCPKKPVTGCCDTTVVYRGACNG